MGDVQVGSADGHARHGRVNRARRSRALALRGAERCAILVSFVPQKSFLALLVLRVHSIWPQRMQSRQPKAAT
eukprot:6533089-Prymnesium_polylepis.2